MRPEKSIVIVGGGCSGVLVAAQLARHPSPVRRRVMLVDRRAATGAGTAFGTRRPCHLLNVPAGRMSAFVDDPGHFARWAAARDATVRDDTFVARSLYGDYLRQILREAAFTAAPMELELVAGEAEAVEVTPDQAKVRLDDGGTILADAVVLALGNTKPANPPVADGSFYDSTRYTRDPWQRGAIDAIDDSGPILLIGSGLTAVDVVLALKARGFRTDMHAVSRHGLVPLAHVAGVVGTAADVQHDRIITARTVPELMHAVREQVMIAGAEGRDWRTVIDSLRPYSQRIWDNLSDDERRRFLRHASRSWEVHRHRMAPAVARSITTLLESDRLTITAGRVIDYDERDDGVVATIRERGGAHRDLLVGHVVNCTGPRPDLTNVGDPLVDALVESGTARPGPLGLGLDVDARGALLDANGSAAGVLFTLGSPRRGRLWETTAVPEIRTQATELADTLLR